MSQPQTWWHNGIKYEYFDSDWTIVWGTQAGQEDRLHGTMINDRWFDGPPSGPAWAGPLPPPGMPPRPGGEKGYF